jgi:hypothetical protein
MGDKGKAGHGTDGKGGERGIILFHDSVVFSKRSILRPALMTSWRERAKAGRKENKGGKGNEGRKEGNEGGKGNA